MRQEYISKVTLAAAKLAPGAKNNITTEQYQATLEKLLEIGHVNAKAIIAGRPCKSVGDAMKISGIKRETFDALRSIFL